MEMAIPGPAEILDLHRCVFPHLLIVTEEEKIFPDLASPLTSVRVPLVDPSWLPPSPFLSTFLEYMHSISEKASATHVLNTLGS